MVGLTIATEYLFVERERDCPKSREESWSGKEFWVRTNILALNALVTKWANQHPL